MVLTMMAVNALSADETMHRHRKVAIAIAINDICNRRHQKSHYAHAVCKRFIQMAVD